MNKIDITEVIAGELFNEETVPGFELVEKEEWDDQGKYQYQTLIFKEDGKFYSNTIQRQGSYFTDYDYQYETECYEVHKVEIIKTAWVNV